jgi:SET domain-containing protein
MRFYIKRSTIPKAGKGLFAKEAMARGETLEVPGSLVLRNSEADQRTRDEDAYKFRVGGYLLIPTGYGRMVNHSLTPNLKKVVKGKSVRLQALRRIKAGEELFFCYSRYARKRFHF